MKLRHLVAFAVLAVIAGTFFSGCSLLGTSIDQRISEFVTGPEPATGRRPTRTSTPAYPAYGPTRARPRLWDTDSPARGGALYVDNYYVSDAGSARLFS